MAEFVEFHIPTPESIQIIDETVFTGVAELAGPRTELIFHPDGELFLPNRAKVERNTGQLVTLLSPLVTCINEGEQEKDPPTHILFNLYNTLLSSGMAPIANAAPWHSDKSYVAATKPTTECLQGTLKVAWPLPSGTTLYDRAVAQLNTGTKLPEGLSIWRPAPRELVHFTNDGPNTPGSLHRSAPYYGQIPILRTTITMSTMHLTGREIVRLKNS